MFPDNAKTIYNGQRDLDSCTQPIQLIALFIQIFLLLIHFALEYLIITQRHIVLAH